MTSCFLQQRHVACLHAVEQKKNPVSLEDRGGVIESGVSTRHDMRSRPPVPPVGDSAAIAIRMFRASIQCLDIDVLQWKNSPLKNESPGRKRPPGASRFSTFFNVAAIGGKSPRTLRLFDHIIGIVGVCQGLADLSRRGRLKLGASRGVADGTSTTS
jgi:hypothetical protein